ncbi:hypothetical protein [Flavobacterium sp. JAS]|uniref:hypothetical protein n=1 Tax=Flavobacterium sp. JAS TaxID=2897329 RepID=UPI001E36F55B|nr:hypothetical protein [Flavobacterium sp. JAS]MCD0471933.1 hypothetical protein [Flavobacterium sp. JAS]
MKYTIYLILFSTLIISCTPKSKFKTIDFISFEMTVPQNWNKIIIRGTDSYVGGIVTDQKDTLIFDIGGYSGDVMKNDFPLVYDKKGYDELSKEQKGRLKKAKYLVVDSLSGDIDYKKYLKQKFVMQKIDCFNAKLITPTNKELGTTGLFIDSLEGSTKEYNKVSMSFYGRNLKEKTEKQFIIALKTIKLRDYCH